MKSLMKKIAAVALAAATAFGMAGVAATTANAADGDTSAPTVPATAGTLEVSSDNAEFNGKTIKAYKMFSASPSVDGESASYTLESSWVKFFEGTPANIPANDPQFSAKAYQYLIDNKDNDSKVLEFAKEASKWAKANLTTNLTATATKNGAKYTATFKDLPVGYYLVAPNGSTNLTRGTNAILANVTKATGNTAELKSEYPTVDKTVEGTGTKQENNDKGSSAQVGDKVDFTVKSKVPDYTEYTKEGFTFTFKFTDTLSKGLDFDANSVTVKVAGVDQPLALNTDYTVDPGTYDAVKGTSITIDLAKSIQRLGTAEATIGKEITVTYSATLNKNAEAGKDDSSNTVKLTYSNDPNDQSSVGDTPESKTHTYDFNFDLKKVDGKDDTKALEGAEFTLKDSDKNAVSLVANADGSYRPIKTGEKGTTTVTTPANGVIKFTGLKAGTYYLEETKAPAGYNKLTSDVTVTITATYNDDGTLKASNVAYSYGNENGTGTTITIKNNEGSLLPGTGGMGTVAFTVIGVLVVAFGVAWAIQRKRANA